MFLSSLILCSDISILLLSPSIEFFILLIVFLVPLPIFSFFAETFCLHYHSIHPYLKYFYNSKYFKANDLALSGHYNICVMSTLMSVDFLFLYWFTFSWFCVCQVTLDCILDILNTVRLWDLFKSLENIDFVLAGIKPGWIQSTSSNQPSVACDFNISFIVKAFTLLGRSLLGL